MNVAGILFYELIDLFPNLILALVPFQKYIRISRLRLVIAILLLYFLLTGSRMLALSSLPAATVLSAVWIVFYLLFYIYCIDCQFTKLLFVLLNILNYGSFVAIIYSRITYHLFSDGTERLYTFFTGMILALVYLVSYPSMYLLMKRKLKALIEFPESNHMWRFLWLVPATFCLAYYYNLYSSGGILAYSARLNNVVFAVLFNLGSLFVTFLIVHLLNESNASLKLKSENYQLNLQARRYEYLQSRIEDARRAGHDLRQNLMIIQSYVRDRDAEGLLQYLGKYIDSLPSDSPIVYCENYVLNALIVYYENIARRNGIRFDASIDYPAFCEIADSNAAILFGNLIENSVDACLRQSSGERFITLHIKRLNHTVVATLDNSYTGNIKRTGNGFLSAKSNRPGIGTASIQRIAEEYHGTAVFEFDEQVFHASVLLNLDTGP